MGLYWKQETTRQVEPHFPFYKSGQGWEEEEEENSGNPGKSAGQTLMFKGPERTGAGFAVH